MSLSGVKGSNVFSSFDDEVSVSSTDSSAYHSPCAEPDDDDDDSDDDEDDDD